MILCSAGYFIIEISSLYIKKDIYMIKMKVHYLQNVITVNEICIIWP